MPRCGRNQERNNDQKPSIVLTWTRAKAVAVFVTRELTLAVTDGLVAIAPGSEFGVNVVFVSHHFCPWRNGLGDDWFDGLLLNIGQHLDDDLAAALDHP